MSASANGGSPGQSLNDLTDTQIHWLYHDWRLWARDDQLPPDQTGGPQDWRVWLLLGGRGAGKTRAGSEWVRAQALGLWSDQPLKPRRLALVGETHADVRRVMIEGDSGLMAVHPESERPHYESSNGRIVWPNGSVAHVFSAESPDSLRGPQFDAAWCDAFLGAMLKRGGIAGTGSLMARSYLKWGRAEAELRTGAVAVLSRGANPALGHVGFVVGANATSLVLLGGNQTNAVTVAAFDRSRLLGVRWPALDAAEAIPEPPSRVASADEERFRICLAHVLQMEGGFSDDPYDPGGPTNQGIILKVYAAYTGQTLDARSKPALVHQLKSIKPETVAAIYRSRYWGPAQCAEMPSGLDLMHFDAAVNHGVGTAIRILQEALGVDADGEIGPITRAALARTSASDAILRVGTLRERRYRALHHFWRFGRGWLRRVEASRVAALAAARPFAPQIPQPQPSKPGDTAMTPSATPATASKWWGHSLTVWGAVVTALAAIVPALGPVTGIEISSDMVRQLGGEIGGIVQALTGLVGTLMTLIGRARASAPLVRRDMSLRL